MDRYVPRKISRRAFLGTAAKVGIGAAGLLAASSGLFYYGAVKHRKTAKPALPANMVKLGTVAELKRLTGVARIDYEAERVDAWYAKPVKGYVYVTFDAKGELLVLSPACSHLGCSVVPAKKTQQNGNEDMYFWCPCHGAGFDSEGGAVFAVTRGLDTYEPIVHDGSVYVDIMRTVEGKEA